MSVYTARGRVLFFFRSIALILEWNGVTGGNFCSTHNNEGLGNYSWRAKGTEKSLSRFALFERLENFLKVAAVRYRVYIYV